jgi:DNA (cytosine-5)-methyltransferase 1
MRNCQLGELWYLSVMFTAVSLFSGAGGFDLGFSKAGFKTVEAHDIDPEAVAVFNANISNVASVTDLSKTRMKLPKVDAVFAGPPCQGFSTIGKMASDDVRNKLFMKSCKLAITANPKVIVIENVPSIASPRYNSVVNRAVKFLKSSGFTVQTDILSANNFGVAQTRRRFFLVARRGRSDFHFDWKVQASKNVGDAFASVKLLNSESPEEFSHGSAFRAISERIEQGQKLCNVRRGENSIHTWDIPTVFGIVTAEERELLEILLVLRRTERKRTFGDADPVSYERIKKEFGRDCKRLLNSLLMKKYIKMTGPLFDLTHTFNGTFRRLRLDGPSPTVDTQFANPRLFLHPTKHRGMSYLEAASLQGFPNDYLWPEKQASRFRMIGNAVPPPLAYHVGLLCKGLL